MTLSVAVSNDPVVLALDGRLDSNNAPEVERELLTQIEGKTGVVLDLGGLDYISSAGLRVLLVSAKKMKQAGTGFVLCSLKPAIREVFDISGFSAILASAPDRAAALAAL